jgi:hypothetical protein
MSSDAGGPHGQSLGILKCTNKTPEHDGKVSVTFSGSHSSAVFTLDVEDAEYFTVGESYDFSAITP